MREIKFRGKTGAGQWIVGDLLHRDGDVYIFPEDANDSIDRYKVDPESVGQFTGIKDKKGVEIFEGDVLDKKYKWVVKWFKGEFIAESAIVGTVAENLFLKKMKRIKADCPIEIVENIHDDPELL